MTTFRSRLRHIVRHLLHDADAQPGVMVQGVVVLWYLDNGLRKFILLRDKGTNTAQFPAADGTSTALPLEQRMQSTLKRTLGAAFMRSMNTTLLGADRVVSAPLLHITNPITGKEAPIQALCWLVQITPEQAQMCAATIPDVEVLAVPEFGMQSQQVHPQHKVVFQSLARHLNDEALREPGMMVDRLEEFLRKMGNSQKNIH